MLSRSLGAFVAADPGRGSAVRPRLVRVQFLIAVK
jgi:hypothetical protein